MRPALPMPAQFGDLQLQLPGSVNAAQDMPAVQPSTTVWQPAALSWQLTSTSVRPAGSPASSAELPFRSR